MSCKVASFVEATPELKEKFFALRNEIFTPTGEVRACGREKCKEFITLCRAIDPKHTYGNLETGHMRIDEIRTLSVWL